jgi:hypothetical protein
VPAIKDDDNDLDSDGSHRADDMGGSWSSTPRARRDEWQAENTACGPTLKLVCDLLVPAAPRMRV